MKPGNEPATGTTQHKFEYQGDPAYCNKTHVYKFHPGMSIRQQFVKDFAAAMLSNPGLIDYVGRLSREQETTDDVTFAALAIKYADTCLIMEEKTREDEL